MINEYIIQVRNYNQNSNWINDTLPMDYKEMRMRLENDKKFYKHLQFRVLKRSISDWKITKIK